MGANAALERPDGEMGVTRWAWRLGCLLIGAALALVFPEANLWWWAYVGLVPLLLLIAAASDRREALWRTWSAGIGFFVVLHHWLAPSLGVFMVPVVIVVAAAWLPFGWAAWRMLRRAAGGGSAIACLVVLPSIWVVTEVVRSWHALGGTWGALGLSQWSARPVLAIAALGGVWLLSALLLVTNVAVALALRTQVPVGVRLGAVGLAILAVGSSVAFGLARGEPEVTDRVRLAGVQPGLIHGPGPRLDANIELTLGLDPDEVGIVDLVVWGQSSVGFDPDVDQAVGELLEGVADEIGVDVLVNVDARAPGGRISKTSVLVRPGVGLDDRYVKQRLVPFGEYIPLRPLLGWLEHLTDAADEDRQPGTGMVLMRSGDLVFGPIISYESTFPDMRRTVSRMGAEMTIVQAASTTFQGSWIQPQQARYEAVRAVESGRPSVLVAVSGTSAGFDPRGRELVWWPSDTTGVFVVDVPLSQEDTVYVRFGDWVPLLAIIVCAVSLARFLARGWRSRRGHATAPEPGELSAADSSSS